MVPVKELAPLNNNNMRGNNGNNNNRRRGRNNNNRPQGGSGGGGQQVNRVDSRARGNAPQMLEKYRKLAHDAHLNGDRVTSEYYLQFADHYFRVIADTRTRQEEARVRRDDRFQDPADTYREEAEDAGELGDASDFPSFDQPPAYNRAPRENGQRENGQRDNNQRDNNQRDNNQRDNNQREDAAPRGDRAPRDDRAPRQERAVREDRVARPGRDDRPRDDRPRAEGNAEATAEAQASDGDDQARNPYEPAENPFVRDNRGSRGLRPRREERRPREDAPAAAPAPVGLDPMYLPPSISAKRRVEEDDTGEAAAKPVVKRRAPVRKAAARKPDSDTGDLLDVAD